MQQFIDFLYDFGNPNCYLVHKVLPRIATRANARLRYVPVLEDGLFHATGNRPLHESHADVRNRLDYEAQEIRRFVWRYGLTYHMSPHFPLSTRLVMRGAVAARGEAWESRYLETIFNAIWVHGQKLDEPAVLAEVLTDAGLPAHRLLQIAEDPKTQAALMSETASAARRGAFGAPTMFAGGEMFFGKSALPDLEFTLAEISDVWQPMAV